MAELEGSIRIWAQVAATWTTDNPVLLSGQFGFASDTKVLKVGDGVSTWADLDPIGATINDVFVYMGGIDCSADPNYPAAEAGETYRVTVAGKIGGAAGPNVEVNDKVVCHVDGSAAGDHATVGANWSIEQTNIDGAVVGPAASTNNNFAIFNGATGKIIKDTGKVLYSDTTFATPTANDIPEALTIKTYIETGAGNGMTNLPIHSDASAVWTYTNMPSAAQMYGGTDRSTPRFRTQFFHFIRLTAQVITLSASANSPNIYIEYSLNGSSGWTKIGAGGVTEVISLSSAGKKETDWMAIPAGLVNQDAYFRVGCVGGDAVADPGIMAVHIQLRAV